MGTGNPDYPIGGQTEAYKQPTVSRPTVQDMVGEINALLDEANTRLESLKNTSEYSLVQDSMGQDTPADLVGPESNNHSQLFNQLTVVSNRIRNINYQLSELKDRSQL